MNRERRKGLVAVPENLHDYLNEEQRLALHKLEGFGCRVGIVRRPLFQQPEIIMVDHKGEVVGVLEEDGTMSKGVLKQIDTLFRSDNEQQG